MRERTIAHPLVWRATAMMGCAVVAYFIPDIAFSAFGGAAADSAQHLVATLILLPMVLAVLVVVDFLAVCNAMAASA